METFAQQWGERPEVRNAFVNLTGEEDVHETGAQIASHDQVINVMVSADMETRFSSMMSSLDVVVAVIIGCAGALAFIVLYNLTNINITERLREIATIKVLGFNQLEVSQYVFRENLFLTAVAAIVGIPMGDWLLKFVIDNIVLSMIYFEPRHGPYDIPIAVALTFVFAFLVNLAMQKRLRDVSMTESLKSVE
jgi:putative ABC transport system permease protein